jgi:hypothetical protein
MMTTKTKRANADATIRAPARKRTKAEILREAMFATKDEQGVHPRGVFEAARNPNSPLHGEFIWDGDKAVEELGLQRAAELIRVYKVELVVKEVRFVAPQFVSDPRENDRRNYVDLQTVKQDENMSKAVMLAELSRIESAIIRARAISGFLEMADDFEAMLEQIVSIRARVG